MYINSASSSALYAAYAIKTADVAVNRASERLSTGLRINSAADDPSGLAKANNIKTYLGSYTTSLSNINDGIAMNQIADKALSAIYSTLSNMYTLAVSSYTADATDDAALITANQSAFESYQDEIDSLASSATYNGRALLTSNSLSVSILAGVNSSDTIDLSFSNAQASALGVATSNMISTPTAAGNAMDDIKDAMETISSYQAQVGAQENILQSRSDFISSAIITNTQAYSNIMDANMAEESANLASAMIKRDAATAMLSQANTMNANIVKYLLQAYGS